MDSPQSGMLRNIEFNFNELGFFLDHPEDVCSNALKDLLEFEWKYQIPLQTIEYQAEAMEELHLAICAKPVANLSNDIIKTIYAMTYRKLEATTSQMIESVDEGLTSAREIYQKFQVALQCLFPGQKFLQINFAG